MFDLTGKVAIVTGSTKGIGRSIAEEMARLGARVVISSRKPEACQAVQAEFEAEGLNAIAIPCHIGSKEQLEALVAETREHFGRIDILVCNAAANPVYGPLADCPDEAWDKVMATNVKSAFWLCNMVIPEMAERRDGAVILVSSIGGFQGSETLGAYCVSKAAEMQLVRNLAVEWGRHNIRVNAIAPGLIRTDFARALWENPVRREQTMATTPLRRLGEPRDIGGVAAFLASEAGAFVTGQTITADGGRTIAGPGG